MPDNSTGLSIAGVIKWLLLVMSLPCFVKAWQGIVTRTTATGSRSNPQLLTGADALSYGLLNLLYATLLLLLAGIVWFFWQRNEE